MSNKVIGIDLGTGFSCVAVMEGGKPTVIVNEEGQRTTPSVIYIENGEREVGSSAKRKMTMKPKNTVSFIKRFMGSNWDDKDVQEMLKRISYEVVNENGKPRVKIDGKLYSPEEISSYTLAKLKKVAENYYGEEVTKAVITVPAWFNDAQRQATKIAGEIAGLKVLRVINEPTAAILSSTIKVDENKDKTVAVFDYGCGTLDVSVCSLSMVDGQLMVEVLASYGDVFLGGENYDHAIVNWLRDEYMKDHPGVDITKDKMAYSRLIEAAEKAKCELSTTASSEINLPYISVQDGVPQHLVVTLTRAKFDQLTADITAKAMECTRKSLEKAKKTANELDSILLVGGSTRLLSVQEALTKEFGVTLDKSSNPDESVALGAVTQANILVGGEAAKDVLLLDVTPLSVGIETEGEVMTVMIEANTTIPTQKKNIFTTAVDNQPSVSIRVFQGERQFTRDNKLIGNFELGGILPAKRGVPQIEVTFDIDASGILKVSAKDLGTNKENNITITSSNSMPKEEVERIKAEAEAHKAEDAKKKADLDKLNSYEHYAYAVQNVLDDETMKDKITEEQRKQLTEGVEKVLDAIKEKDSKKAESAQKELEGVFGPIASELYKQSNPNSGQPNSDFGQQFQDFMKNQGQGPKTDGPTDVDFDEVK